MRLLTPQSLARESASKAAADLAQRQRATTILTPEALAGRGRTVSAAVRALSTSLGGQIRPITLADLQAFKRGIERLQAERKTLAGILPSEILGQSLPADLQRAKAEIAHAVPFRFAEGVVSFQTSASRQNGESRHIVRLQLAGWAEATASPLPPGQAAKVAAERPIRFECSCGRHRYWLRYIATIGGWNLGRPETGFPKIRNPGLVGVACKHVLRTVAELGAAGVRGQLARAVAQERNRLAGKTSRTVHVVEQAQAQVMLAKQQAKPRDVQRLASRWRNLLRGKAPAAALRPLTRSGLEREANLAAARLAGLGLSQSEIARIKATILASKVQA